MNSLAPWRGRGSGFLSPLRQEMEELFGRFFEPMAMEERESSKLRAWSPRVDIEETDKELCVKADLPGIDAKDVEISVSNGCLILHGEKKEEKEDKKKNFHRMERFVGQFYREIPLPSGTDANKIVATSSKGVITVTIPKNPEVQAKKITVKPQD